MSVGLAVERKALDVPVEGIESVVSGDHGAVRGQQSHADDVGSADHQLRLRLWREAHDAALTSKRTGDVEIARTVEGQALRTAESAEKRADFAGGIDAIDLIEARSRGAGNVQVTRSAERQVIGGHGRLERRKNKNFAVRTDFENRAAAIAHVEAAGLVEREARGDAHALDPLHRAAV